MPYIGKQPEIGAYKKLDSITAVNGQAAYTLQYNSANYSPASANHLIVSLNGVIQAPQDSFTVSGSTLTFASNLSTGDSIDFILALGDVLNVATVSDNTITNDKLATAPTIISKGDGGSTDGAIQLNCSQNSHGVKIKSPPHSAAQSYTLTLPSTAPSANKFLQTDGSGNLSFADASADMVLLSDNTLSGASSVNFDNTLITSTYKMYKIYIIVYPSTTTGLGLYYSTDNGSTMNSTSDVRIGHETSYTTSTAYRNVNVNSYWALTGYYYQHTSTTVPMMYEVTVWNPTATAYTGLLSYGVHLAAANVYFVQRGNGAIENSSSINYIRVAPNTAATMTSGSIKLYGVK